jgi:CBS domain-containing protein
MKVKEAMHRGVEWVGPDTPVTEIAKLMCAHNIGAIPIGENDQLIGKSPIGTSSARVWRKIVLMCVARPRAM